MESVHAAVDPVLVIIGKPQLARFVLWQPNMNQSTRMNNSYLIAVAALSLSLFACADELKPPNTSRWAERDTARCRGCAPW